MRRASSLADRSPGRVHSRPLPPDRPGRLAAWVALPGCIALVYEPLVWLLQTWRDPSYASDGMWVALAVAALFLRSVASGPAPPDAGATRRAVRLLLATAALRLGGRLLAIKTLGALALVVDVAALALLAGLPRRPWALGPFALASLGLLALPVEHLLQRGLGFPLQLLTARIAHTLLAPFVADLSREGTLLVHPEITLAVDLPCSGARGLMWLGGLALCVACRRRVGVGAGLLGGLAVLVGAATANVLRVVLLLGASLHGPDTAIAVSEEPLHTALGTASLVVGALSVFGWTARLRPREARRPLPVVPSADHRTRPGLLAALAISVCGIGIALAPSHPLDVSRARVLRGLPEHLIGATRIFVGSEIPLNAQESHYFARYGGAARKREYRDADGTPHTVLQVRTHSPLRHLHGPDRCLLGEGHRVTRLGVRPGPRPTLVYRSEAPDGRAWRVEASFMSERGQFAQSVSEVVWRWLEEPATGWSLVERISPWPACAGDVTACRERDATLFAALTPELTGSIDRQEITP